MSEEAVQRLMGLHDKAADAYVENCLADERGDAEAYERSRMDMHQTRSTLESALREVLKQPLGDPANAVGLSAPLRSAAIPIATGHDLRDGDPEDDVIPTLPAGHVWCCGNGCGDCRAILIPFEYSRTETVDGELLESRSVMRAASHCCKAPLMIWDEVNDTEGPEPDFRASDRSPKGQDPYSGLGAEPAERGPKDAPNKDQP